VGDGVGVALATVGVGAMACGSGACQGFHSQRSTRAPKINRGNNRSV
jgi:hypothetical protein